MRPPATVLLALVLATSCVPSADGPDASLLPLEPAELMSPAFADGAPIPVEHTCDGDDIPPPLSWDGTHPEAVEVVLVFDDPEAPSGRFVHWLVAGLPPVGSIQVGVLHGGTVEGVNDFGRGGYGGPCPPPGDPPHTYRIEVVGLSEPSGVEPGFTPDELAQATAGTRVSSAVLTGTYGR